MRLRSINRLKDPRCFSDVAGTFQALVGLWQILVRQQSIPESQADAVFSGIAGSFSRSATTGSCSTPAAAA
jgi:hypothetical protein